MSFEVEFDDEEVTKFFNRILHRIDEVNNGRSAYAALVGALVYKDINKHFEEESGPKGAWSPWSKIYSEHMKRKGKGGNKILRDTSHLWQSFKPANYRVQSDGILWFNNAQKNNFPYAFAHNEGALGMPQREFMYASEEAKEQVLQQTAKFILDQGEK